MSKDNRKNLVNILTGFGVILFYLIATSFPESLLMLFNVDYSNLSLAFKSIYLILYEALITLVIIYVYRKDVIPNFKDFIKNNIKYFKKYIKYWFIMLGLMMLSNLIIINFTSTDISNNQQIIVDTLKYAPIYTFIVSVLIAPILEELVFRLSFRKIINKNNILYIIISGLIFGSMHVIGDFNSIIDLLFIIPYSIPGFIFAYIYSKSNNICISMSIHFIHNGIMMSLQILLMLLL